ncbi:MAG: class II aldolase/adducin family protein [Acidobacteria bacterium]|nr:class II aldolase/adducin family protein [Acidobacteriota bacterium]
MRHERERAEVVRYGLEMERRGLTSGTSGNVSLRVEEGVLITPSSIPYPLVAPADIVLMDLDGTVLQGERAASVEHKVHLACYRARPEVRGVVHSHPVVATAFAAARVPLPSFLDELGVYAGAEVRVAGYALSGTDELAANVAAALGEDSSAVLIASHGLVTVGRDLAAAMRVAELVERGALTYLCAKALGGPAEIPESSRELFRQVFAYYRTKPD